MSAEFVDHRRQVGEHLGDIRHGAFDRLALGWFQVIHGLRHARFQVRKQFLQLFRRVASRPSPANASFKIGEVTPARTGTTPRLAVERQVETAAAVLVAVVAVSFAFAAAVLVAVVVVAVPFAFAAAVLVAVVVVAVPFAFAAAVLVAVVAVSFAFAAAVVVAVASAALLPLPVSATGATAAPLHLRHSLIDFIDHAF